MPKRNLVVAALSYALAAGAAHGQDGEAPGESRAKNEGLAARSPFAVDDRPDKPRSDIGMPLLSFLLPGIDQWIEGQHPYGLLYSGIAVGGLVYANHVAQRNELKVGGTQAESGDDDKNDDGEDDEEALDQKDVAVRKYTLGTLLYQGAGGMSAYHSFRTSVLTRKHHGQYDFLEYEESPADIMMAPFRFQYLTRASTYVPLAIITAFSVIAVNQPIEDDAEIERDTLSSSDAFFAGAFSLNAGTHEEAMFRGWIMPVMMEYWQTPFWSNVAQSVLFAAAHLPTNPTPLPQLLLGYHLGNVTMDNRWRIGEAVFIHTWWDVVAFTAQYHYKLKDPEAPEAVLWLPPLYWYF